MATKRGRRARRRQQINADVLAARVQRLATALKEARATVDRPNDALSLSDVDSAGEAAFRTSRALRERLGDEYIAAIAEQRPGVDGHGYPGGQPDWDDTNRLYLDRHDVFSKRSLVLPDWFALPLVRRVQFAQTVNSEAPESDT